MLKSFKMATDAVWHPVLALCYLLNQLVVFVWCCNSNVGHYVGKNPGLVSQSFPHEVDVMDGSTLFFS